MDSRNEQIIEYLRGELEGAELAAFEELLVNNANFRKEFNKQKALWDLFGKLPEVNASESLKEKTLYAVKHYKKKSMKIRVFRAEDKIEQLKKKETRRLFTPVSAAAAILILAAVVITILLSENAMKMEFADEAKVALETPKAMNALTDDANEVADEEENEPPEFMDEELEGWDSNSTKKVHIGNNTGSDDKPLINLDKLKKDSELWPEVVELGNRPRGGTSKRIEFFKSEEPEESGNNPHTEEGFDGAPSEESKGSNDKIEYKEENLRKIDSNNVYAFFIDMNISIDEKLTTNQKLNLSYDLADKVSTRLDLVKYEIIKDLNKLDNNDKFSIIVFYGTTAFTFNRSGNLSEFKSSEKSLSVSEQQISVISKALDELATHGASRNNMDVLSAAKNVLNTHKNGFTNVKFFTASTNQAKSDKKKEAMDDDLSKDSLSSNVEIVDLGGKNSLQGWASENGFSYSPR